MKIIDLSQSLYDGMSVYPGDPEVHIKQVHSLDKETWRLRYLQFSSHIGTHADAFSHMDENGETIDNIPIERYVGETVLVTIELEVKLERKLLQVNILTITDLVNMDDLPIDKPFMFYGVPLKIKDGGGSPIRAFAVLED